MLAFTPSLGLKKPAQNELADIDVLNSNMDTIDAVIPLSNMARQAIINGNFDVWQRGASFTDPVNAIYTSDRWQHYFLNTGTSAGPITHSRQTVTAGDLPGSTFYYRVQTNGSGSGFGTDNVDQIAQKIENGVRYLCGDGKKVTVSFCARSSIPGKRLGVSLQQNYGIGGSNPENISGSTFTLTSTWMKYEFTFTSNTLADKLIADTNFLAVFFGFMWGDIYVPVFNSGTPETYVGTGNIDIAQVQVCAGDVALPFQPRSSADELALCQRYFEKSYNISVTPGAIASDGALGWEASGSTFTGTNVIYKVKKRMNATVTLYSPGTGLPGKIYNQSTNADVAALPERNGENGFKAIVNNVGVSATQLLQVHYTADAEL